MNIQLRMSLPCGNSVETIWKKTGVSPSPRWDGQRSSHTVSTDCTAPDRKWGLMADDRCLMWWLLGRIIQNNTSGWYKCRSVVFIISRFDNHSVNFVCSGWLKWIYAAELFETCSLQGCWWFTFYLVGWFQLMSLIRNTGTFWRAKSCTSQTSIEIQIQNFPTCDMKLPKWCRRTCLG